MKIILFLIILFPSSISIYKLCWRAETLETKKSGIDAAGISFGASIEKMKAVIIITGDAQQIKANKKTAGSKHRKEYFKLLNAASENWTAGAANGGSGTEYYFKIKIKTSDKILFDSAWIGGKAFSIYISKKTKTVSSQPVKYVNRDTITLRVSDIHSAKVKNNNPVNNNPPISFNGAALIAYTVNGNREYFTVKEIKKQKQPNRP